MHYGTIVTDWLKKQKLRFHSEFSNIVQFWPCWLLYGLSTMTTISVSLIFHHRHHLFHICLNSQLWEPGTVLLHQVCEIPNGQNAPASSGNQSLLQEFIWMWNSIDEISLFLRKVIVKVNKRIKCLPCCLFWGFIASESSRRSFWVTFFSQQSNCLLQRTILFPVWFFFRLITEGELCGRWRESREMKPVLPLLTLASPIVTFQLDTIQHKFYYFFVHAFTSEHC